MEQYGTTRLLLVVRSTRTCQRDILCLLAIGTPVPAMMCVRITFLCSLLVLANAGGYANTRIGKPCVAGDTAMQVYSDADHGGLVDMSGKVAVVTGTIVWTKIMTQ